MSFTDTFTVGTMVEAIDSLGVWSSAKVVSNNEDSHTVTFPPWADEWNRQITSKEEIRPCTVEHVLIPRNKLNQKVCFQSNNNSYICSVFLFNLVRKIIIMIAV